MTSTVKYHRDARIGPVPRWVSLVHEYQRRALRLQLPDQLVDVEERDHDTKHQHLAERLHRAVSYVIRDDLRFVTPPPATVPAYHRGDLPSAVDPARNLTCPLATRLKSKTTAASSLGNEPCVFTRRPRRAGARRNGRLDSPAVVLHRGALCG